MVKETQKTIERCKSAQLLSARGVVSRLREEGSGEVFRIKEILNRKTTTIKHIEKKEISEVKQDLVKEQQMRS
jgi:hypothetical protein